MNSTDAAHPLENPIPSYIFAIVFIRKSGVGYP